MIPILLNGLNSQGLNGTTTSWSQLYLSPYSYVNALRLDNLLFLEQLFNETYDKLDQIIKRRQQRLTKKQILDKVHYQEGNIILAVNHPITHKKGQSQELATTVRGVHYVKKVFPEKLRVVGLFSGEERTLPRTYCQKISLDNLSKLSFQLQSLQFQRVADNLFRANKYLQPSYKKTWNALLDKANTFSPEFDYNQDPVPEDFPGLDTVSPDAPAVQKAVDTHETNLQPDSDESTPSQTDIYGDPVQEVAEKPQRMPLRFGWSYNADTCPLPNPPNNPASVLKISCEFYEAGATPEDHQTAAYKRACLAAESHGLKIRSVLWDLKTT